MVINQVECVGRFSPAAQLMLLALLRRSDQSRLFDCDCLFIRALPPVYTSYATSTRYPDRELEASAEECPDRELEASADEYPDKELKASVVKELDPPAQTITSVDGCPDRELER
ncbi:hypothetical protein V8E54_004657 [Elaphomyces granulatus]